MLSRNLLAATLFSTLLVPAAARAGDADETFRWLSETEDVLAEGILWNDTLGDGEDRYKSGGLTQSWVFPESIFSDGRWIGGHAAAIEVQARGFVATPDDTSRASAGDRPYAQFAGIGVYLRLAGEPDRLTSTTAVMTEDRVGIEIGFQGEPLPLFEVQEAVHAAATGMPALARGPANSLDAEVLVNLEARRTWRIHGHAGGHDIQVAPFVQTSLGMRENSVRTGSDLIVGSSLEARTWNAEPAVGALMVGGSRPRKGVNWAAWIGGDLGYVASDSLLDGGFAGDGPSVGREAFTARARAGLMIEYGDFALVYSLAWLSPEFETQPEGQLIGAVQIKIRY